MRTDSQEERIDMILIIGTVPVVPAGCASGYTGRRRTDLLPTIPTRDPSFHSSRKSLNHSPGRAYSMTRLDQLAKPRRRPDLPSLAEANPFDPRPLSSSSRVSSITRSMSHLAVSKSGQAQPARRNLSKADSRSLHQLAGEGAFVVPRTTRTSQLREQKLHASANCSEASSRPSSSLSQQSTNSVTSSVSVRHRLNSTPRKPRPASIAITGVTQENKPPLPKTRKPLSKSGSITERGHLKNKAKSPVDGVSKTVKNTLVQSTASKGETLQKPPDTAPVIQQKPVENHAPPVENVPAPSENFKEYDIVVAGSIEVIKAEETLEESKNLEKLEKLSLEDEKRDLPKDIKEEPVRDQKVEPIRELKQVEIKQKVVEQPKTNISSETSKDFIAEQSNNTDNTENNSNNVMTASMIKVRINTEEEAKAALAEKRRLIREETERQAELERLRIEAEAKAELERQQMEEEQVRQLIELRRQAEQERLQEAIRETQKREEEERLKREEDQRLKLLKEEAEKKAKEDAEKQKAELQERLKNEEKEREARRKRVEAIMLRTRGKNNSNSPSQQSTEDKNNENKSDEDNKSVEESKVNGTKIVEQQENGTIKNMKGDEIVDNIIASDIVKNANTVTIDPMNTSDSINSNNPWRDTQQYGNFVINNNS
nr:MAP7 domain-containing protein 1-like [Leptinotarsa decemlineata]